MANEIYRSLVERVLEINSNMPEPKPALRRKFEDVALNISNLRQDYNENYENLSSEEQETFYRLINSVQQLVRDRVDLCRVRSMRVLKED